MRGDLFGGQVFDIAQDQGGPLTRRQGVETGLQVFAALGAKEQLFGAVLGRAGERLSQIVDLAEVDAAWRRRKSMAVLVAIRDSQCAALSRSFN